MLDNRGPYRKHRNNAANASNVTCARIPQRPRRQPPPPPPTIPLLISPPSSTTANSIIPVTTSATKTAAPSMRTLPKSHQPLPSPSSPPATQTRSEPVLNAAAPSTS
nr:unnamed protein product [Spirometra erinaceieuropaei]